jgi:fucose 4-O-acetylase-like acetyltransferase
LQLTPPQNIQTAEANAHRSSRNKIKTMIETEQDAIKGNRIFYLDNLRTFMIFLVVLLHAGIVYDSSGFAALFWIVYDPLTNNLVGDLNLIIDIFVMSTIFFISGFLTPLSMKNKTWMAFLKSKFKRIMIPWVFAVFTLIPIFKFLFLYSRNLPQQKWTTYFHFNNGIFSQSWLWFLPVLFLFQILYFLFVRINIKLSHITLKQGIGAIFLIGFIYSFCMDIFKGQDWTKTILIDFQNERLLIYFMIFLLGSLCYKLKTFESKWKNKNLYITIICTVWLPITLYRFFYLNALIRPGNYVFSEIVDALLMWFSFHLSLLGLLYIMINTFRYYLNKQGKIIKELNNNSYNVYIIHVIVIGGIALTMLNTTIPSVLKFIILTVSSYTACNLLIYFYKKVIKAKVLN